MTNGDLIKRGDFSQRVICLCRDFKMMLHLRGTDCPKLKLNPGAMASADRVAEVPKVN
jgi:hypothetical protein